MEGRVHEGSPLSVCLCCSSCRLLRLWAPGFTVTKFTHFKHSVGFLSGHRVLFKSVPENWGLSACGTTHEATSRISSGDRPHPEVRREGREPLQTKQGNRLTARDQKGRRGSDEVVPGTSVVPSSETGMSRLF